MSDHMVRLVDVIQLLSSNDVGCLKGTKVIQHIHPGHGPCCTCQKCGFLYEDCVCSHNVLLTGLQKLPSTSGVVLPADLEEAIANVIFLADFGGDDESILDFDDEYIRYLNQKWKHEFLIEKNAEHCGDCTQSAAPCIRCYVDRILNMAKRIVNLRHARGGKGGEG